MGYNINSGYGKLVQSTPFSPAGQVFVVGDSSVAGVDVIKQRIKPFEGKVRYHATIDSAVGQCAANRGDVIYVAPGHAEAISSATALVMDVAGVKVIGLGEGSNRPTLTFTTAAAASIPVSVNDVSFENIVFTANFADITACFTLTTAKHFALKNCEFNAAAADVNFLAIVETNTTDNAADGLSVLGCTWVEPDTATTSMVNVDGDLDGFKFKGNYLNLGVNTSDLPAVAEVATGKDLTNAQIGGMNPMEGNVIVRLNDANPLLVTADTTTANTGYVANNYVRHADTAGELLITAGTNLGMFENYATAAVDASGYILPARDS